MADDRPIIPDPLDSRRPAHVGVKKGYSPKKWLFYRCWLV